MFGRKRVVKAGGSADAPATIPAGAMERLFEPPRWLRSLGRTSWLIVGAAAVLVGLVWISGITASIVEPVVTGAVVAAVCAPGVTWLVRHRVPRAAGAGLMLLALLAIAVGIFLLVVGGIVEQSAQIKAAADEALSTIEGWVNDADANGTSGASQDVKDAVAGAGSTLLEGVAGGIQGLTSVAFYLSFTLFSLFFLLKDGPTIKRWIDRHLPGVPPELAAVVTGQAITSLQRYFIGVSIVAAFNAVVVGLGALALGVPLAGTIAVVTFATAYIPFIGAFVAGAFAVLIALGSEGSSTALIMLVIVILANGMLQQVVQPIAFGATLDLQPPRRPRRDDRGGEPVRHGRPDPRGAAHLGRRAHQPRPRAGPRRGGRPGAAAAARTGLTGSVAQRHRVAGRQHHHLDAGSQAGRVAGEVAGRVGEEGRRPRAAGPRRRVGAPVDRHRPGRAQEGQGLRGRLRVEVARARASGPQPHTGSRATSSRSAARPAIAGKRPVSPGEVDRPRPAHDVAQRGRRRAARGRAARRGRRGPPGPAAPRRRPRPPSSTR